MKQNNIKINVFQNYMTYFSTENNRKNKIISRDFSLSSNFSFSGKKKIIASHLHIDEKRIINGRNVKYLD